MNQDLYEKALRLGWGLEFQSGDFAGPHYILTPPVGDDSRGWFAVWKQFFREGDEQLVFYPDWIERRMAEIETERIADN